MSETRAKILRGIESIQNLPTMPENATFLLMALDDDMADPRRIVALLRRDVAISANVLRVANSAYYSYCSKPIASLDRAVARIGLVEVRNIVAAAGVIQAFSSFASRSHPKEFWKHAVCVALVTEVLRPRVAIAKFRSHDAGHALYFGGLMHDVGLLLLGNAFPNLYDNLISICSQNKRPLKSIEYETLGVTHGEIGAFLAKKWNLPREVCDAVMYHHFPDAAPDETRPYVQLVHLAKYICVHQKLGDSGVMDDPTFFESALYALGLEMDNLPSIVERVRLEAERGLALVS